MPDIRPRLQLINQTILKTFSCIIACVCDCLGRELLCQVVLHVVSFGNYILLANTMFDLYNTLDSFKAKLMIEIILFLHVWYTQMLWIFMVDKIIKPLEKNTI